MGTAQRTLKTPTKYPDCDRKPYCSFIWYCGEKRKILWISLSGTEEFNFGSVTGINDANTSGSDVFTFAGSGIFLPAGTGITLSAGGPAGSDVGLEALTIHVKTDVVPEPGSLSLLGLAGLVLVARRKRSRA